MNTFFKKIAALSLTAVMMCGCAGKEKPSVLKDGDSDSEYVHNKGTLIVGITDFAPMDFKENGEWSGFDAQLAVMFAKTMGVDPEFVEIDWDRKAQLLKDGTIDCVWNGMTYTDELAQEITCSDVYISNAQVIIMKEEAIGEYSSAEDCQHLLFAAETGSTGESILKEKNYRYTVCDTQKDALQSVVEGKTDAAVIDIIMAGYYTADGNEFDKLAFNFPLNDEKICVGLRKNSDLTDELNKFLKGAGTDGTMEELAEIYGIKEAILE